MTASSSAFQTQYVQELVKGFDKTVSVLRGTVATKYLNQGSNAVFLVGDTVGVNAVTRGINGLIPPRSLNLTQNTCTLTPWHDLVTVNDFNMFASQSDLRFEMQRRTMAVINRKIDDDIITSLNLGTVNTGAAQAASINLIAIADTKMSNAFIPDDGKRTLLGTPAFINFLLQTPEFSNAQYVDTKPFQSGGPAAFGDMRGYWKWNGYTVIKDATLPGTGTNAEVCFLYHADAIGHAMNVGDLSFKVGFNDEQLYSYANATGFMGTKLLQNAGVVKINHDGSTLS